jgi:hypothetical protein
MWINSQDTQPGGRTEIAVLERLRRILALQLAPDPAARIQACLHGHLSNAGQLAHAHQVADNRDLRVAADGEVVLYCDAAGAVALGTGGRARVS